MAKKNHKIEFYTGQVGSDGKAGKVSELLHELFNSQSPQILNINGTDYEIRDLKEFNGGASYRGCFAKYRVDDLPHAGEPGGVERELALSDEEGLIEKNYFLYFRHSELLVFQRNGHASNTNSLGQFFSDLSNETVIFNPVLQPEPMRRLFSEKITTKSLSLSIARPTNPEFYEGKNWSSDLLELLSSSGGSRIRLDITTDRRSIDPEQRKLHNNMRKAVAFFVQNSMASVARFEVEDEDGRVHPIDLIADRLISNQSVTMIGRYPESDGMFNALRKAKDESSDALEEIFGVNGNALD